MAYEPTVSITMGRKVNVGNYESADVHVSLNQIPVTYTEADIQAMIDGPVRIAFQAVASALKEKCDEIKRRATA